MTIHNWGIEYCKSYAEQLRDKTQMHRAVHAAECIEYLLSLVQKEWVGLTDDEVEEIDRWVDFKEEGSGRIPTAKLVLYIEAKLKEKNND